MEPNLRRAVELFSQGIKQGSLFTKSGNPQNFSGSRKPFISTDPVPVNQGRTPIPPSFRPNPVSPGQLGLFDIRATPSPSVPVVPNQNPGGSLDRYGAIARYGALATQEPPGQLATINKTPGGSLLPTSRDLRIFLENIGPYGTPSLGGALALAAKLEGSAPEPNYRNLGYASEADMRRKVSAQEQAPLEAYARIKARDQEFNTNRTDAGRYVPGSQQRTIPENLTDAQRLESYARIKARDQEFNTNRTDASRYMPGSQQQAVINQNPLPQTTPPGNTMTPASAAFTRFFVDDANRLSPTARELATATGGVQTRDLGSLTSGLRAADLESLLNSVGSAQAMSDSPSFMAGNPLTGTPKLMLTGAREQAVNEQKQQYAKQDMGSSKLDTNKMQQEALLNVQAQREAGRVLMPDILRGLGYTTNETAGLAEWARTHPELALAEYNRQIQRGSLASNLNVRSEFPSPAEIQPRDPVNYKPVGNVSDFMVNTPMGSNFSNNAIGNSHYAAEAYVTGSQTATDLADATQALVQPTLQTEDQYTSQAPERMQATADISNDMLRRAMELKMGRSGQPNLFYGN